MLSLFIVSGAGTVLLTATASAAGQAGSSSGPRAASRRLTFDERVAAQRAIEQVYWNHRIWPKENPQPKPPLSAVMPDEAIRAKVEDYLKKSNALEKWWQRPITAEQLQAEMDRMAKGSRDPRLLSELFAVLGNDPFVIAETLARQTLANRLIVNWYANDARFHGAVMRKAESALAACNNADCMKSMGGRYSEATWVLIDSCVMNVLYSSRTAGRGNCASCWQSENSRTSAASGDRSSHGRLVAC